MRRQQQLDFSGIKTYSASDRINLVTIEKLMVPGVTPHEEFVHEGFDELVENGTVSEYSLYKWKGAKFDTIDNSGDRIAGFTIQSDTMNELRIKHKKALENMRVIDMNGKDIMRKDLLTDI